MIAQAGMSVKFYLARKELEISVWHGSDITILQTEDNQRSFYQTFLHHWPGP